MNDTSLGDSLGNTMTGQIQWYIPDVYSIYQMSSLLPLLCRLQEPQESWPRRKNGLCCSECSVTKIPLEPGAQTSAAESVGWWLTAEPLPLGIALSWKIHRLSAESSLPSRLDTCTSLPNSRPPQASLFASASQFYFSWPILFPLLPRECGS